ncbi:unnamed protein product [Auanema sp. JU1783]|nr:unnamed protein product [Auanema sp. JU1783]
MQRRSYRWSASSPSRLNNWDTSTVFSHPLQAQNRNKFYAETHPGPVTRKGVSSGLMWSTSVIPHINNDSPDSRECSDVIIFDSPASSSHKNKDIMNESTEFSLYSDPSHSSSLLSNFATLREDNSLCDIELVAEGFSIMAHKCVLAATIPYFRVMFSGKMIESRMNSITMNDIHHGALKVLVDYVYTNQIRIDSENVQNILFAASILQMDSVCIACQKFLSRFLTTNNCLSIRQFAERHNCTDLLESTQAFAVDHFSELRASEEFLAIPFNQLRDLISSDTLLVRSEEEVFEAIMLWVNHDISNREKYLFELITHIRFSQINVKYFKAMIRKYTFFSDDVRCRDLVSEAALDMLFPSESYLPPTREIMYPENIDHYSVVPSTSSKPSVVPSERKLTPRKALTGVIFCAGGRGTVGVPFRSVEAYDWRRNIWIPVPEMIQPRRHVGVVGAHGKLYAIGGHDGQAHLATAEVFDPALGCWKSVAPMKTSRRGIAAAAIDGAIYAVGGLDDHTCFPNVERYDIELNQWTAVASMCTHRGGVGVTTYQTYLFAIGGNDGTHSLDSCECYDPVLNKWKMLKHMFNRRAGAGVAVLDGFLYAVGGFDDNSPLATCERYDLLNNQWEILSNMTTPRGGVGVASMGGFLYAIGGHDGLRYLNTVERFDPVSNTWSPVADIRECRAGAGVAWASVSVRELEISVKDCQSSPFEAGQCI